MGNHEQSDGRQAPATEALAGGKRNQEREIRKRKLNELFSVYIVIRMPRKTKSNINVEDSEIEQVLEMPKLERQTNAKRKIVLNDDRITKTERKSNPWVDHCKKYAAEKGCSYKQAISEAKESYSR